MSIINFYAFQGIQDEQKAVEKFLEKIPQVNQKVTSFERFNFQWRHWYHNQRNLRVCFGL